jgi:hypothetical protein
VPASKRITISYSTARQSAAPIVSALGTSLPQRETVISTVSLVNQQGPERGWNWQHVAAIQLAAC